MYGELKYGNYKKKGKKKYYKEDCEHGFKHLSGCGWLGRGALWSTVLKIRTFFFFFQKRLSYEFKSNPIQTLQMAATGLHYSLYNIRVCIRLKAGRDASDPSRTP